MRTSSLTPSEAANIVSDSERAFTADQDKPTWKETLERFPTLQPHLKDDGAEKTLDYLADCTNPEQRTRRLYEVEEMFSTFHRKDCDLGQEKQGRTEKVVLRDPQGRIREVLPEFEERVAIKTGARRARTNRATLLGFVGYVRQGGDHWGRDKQGLWWKRIAGQWTRSPEGPNSRGLD